MEEAESEQTQANTPNPVTHDIKEIPDYRIRNRTEQPTNPFFITEKGTPMAGVLMANVPGENMGERINYLTHMFKLAKEDRHLIVPTFLKGNHWFTVHFKLELDMRNCIERLNNKEGEDFKILCLRGGPTKEIAEEPIGSTSHNNKKTSSLKGKKPTIVKNVLPKDPPNESPKATHTNSDRKDKTLTEQQQTANKGTDIRLARREKKDNMYKLTQKKTDKGIAMMIGTFPGANRQEQLAILAEIFNIPVANDLINIEHFNGNSWFTGYFQNEKERSFCIDKMIEINKEIINIDASATNKTFKVHKLENINPRTQKEKPTHSYNNQASATAHMSKTQNMNSAQQPKPIANTKETTVQILDIPADFTTNRIKGAIKRYGWISHMRINTDRRRNSKTATVTFKEITIDLNNTWAVPMGGNMARIAPYANWKETVQKRNLCTARLYGINANTTASRIMSAIKHTNAKTAHIPLNSKTNKKRRFAIIGFNNNTDRVKAIKSHISLFGNKTWWSTKVNPETTEGYLKTDMSSTEDEPLTEPTQEEATDEEWSSTEDSNPHPKRHNQEEKGKQKENNKGFKNRQPKSNVLHQLSQQLRLLNTRIARLESNNRFKKEIGARPNFS